MTRDSAHSLLQTRTSYSDDGTADELLDLYEYMGEEGRAVMVNSRSSRNSDNKWNEKHTE